MELNTPGFVKLDSVMAMIENRASNEALMRIVNNNFTLLNLFRETMKTPNTNQNNESSMKPIPNSKPEEPIVQLSEPNINVDNYYDQIKLLNEEEFPNLYDILPTRYDPSYDSIMVAIKLKLLKDIKDAKIIEEQLLSTGKINESCCYATEAERAANLLGALTEYHKETKDELPDDKENKDTKKAVDIIYLEDENGMPLALKDADLISKKHSNTKATAERLLKSMQEGQLPLCRRITISDTSGKVIRTMLRCRREKIRIFLDVIDENTIIVTKIGFIAEVNKAEFLDTAKRAALYEKQRPSILDVLGSSERVDYINNHKDNTTAIMNVLSSTEKSLRK